VGEVCSWKCFSFLREWQVELCFPLHLFLPNAPVWRLFFIKYCIDVRVVGLLPSRSDFFNSPGVWVAGTGPGSPRKELQSPKLLDYREVNSENGHVQVQVEEFEDEGSQYLSKRRWQWLFLSGQYLYEVRDPQKGKRRLCIRDGSNTEISSLVDHSQALWTR